MPIYVFECQSCKEINEFMLGLSEVGSVQTGDVADLEDFICVCTSCGKTVFKKLPTPCGKTAINWGSWNEKRATK